MQLWQNAEHLKNIQDNNQSLSMHLHFMFEVSIPYLTFQSVDAVDTGRADPWDDDEKHYFGNGQSTFELYEVG